MVIKRTFKKCVSCIWKNSFAAVFIERFLQCLNEVIWNKLGICSGQTRCSGGWQYHLAYIHPGFFYMDFIMIRCSFSFIVHKSLTYNFVRNYKQSQVCISDGPILNRTPELFSKKASAICWIFVVYHYSVMDRFRIMWMSCLSNCIYDFLWK